jgi:hypothetical protein
MARSTRAEFLFHDLPEATLRVLRGKLPPAEMAEFRRLQTQGRPLNAAERRRSFAIMEAANLRYGEIEQELAVMRQERAAEARAEARITALERMLAPRR